MSYETVRPGGNDPAVRRQYPERATQRSLRKNLPADSGNLKRRTHRLRHNLDTRPELNREKVERSAHRTDVRERRPVAPDRDTGEQRQAHCEALRDDQ